MRTCDLRVVLALAQSRTEQGDESASEVLPADAVEREVDTEVRVEQQVEVVLQNHYLAHSLRLDRLKQCDVITTVMTCLEISSESSFTVDYTAPLNT